MLITEVQEIGIIELQRVGKDTHTCTLCYYGGPDALLINSPRAVSLGPSSYPNSPTVPPNQRCITGTNLRPSGTPVVEIVLLCPFVNYEVRLFQQEKSLTRTRSPFPGSDYPMTVPCSAPEFPRNAP